eukprot:scaffold28819_cov31-Phaeocystis_antarctica.AAC.3
MRARAPVKVLAPNGNAFAKVRFTVSDSRSSHRMRHQTSPLTSDTSHLTLAGGSHPAMATASAARRRPAWAPA